jgi:hypothetical protein
MTEAEMIAAVAERLYRIDCEQHDWPYVPGNSTKVDGAEWYAERAAGVIDALRPALAPGWQPIISARKDGTRILLRWEGTVSEDDVMSLAAPTDWIPPPEGPKEGE